MKYTYYSQVFFQKYIYKLLPKYYFNYFLGQKVIYDFFHLENLKLFKTIQLYSIKFFTLRFPYGSMQ